MSNPTNTPDSTPDFDLFGVPDEDNLKEQLAKGTFQWTNKYTRILAVVLVLVGCLSAGAVYGHYEATKSSSGGLTGGNFASLRSAFASAGGASALAGASGASGFAGGGFAGGGFAGGGFSRGTAGTVSKVSGNTVTITLSATPPTPIKVGDNVTVRGATTGAGGFGAAAGGLTGGTGTGTSAGAGASGGTSAGTPAGAGAGAASGAPRAGGAGGAGGRFSNPAFTACLAKAGVTFTAGTRPNFQDPKVAAAIQSCATSLGLSAPGAGGGGFGSRSAGGSGSSSGSSAPAAPAPAASPSN